MVSGIAKTNDILENIKEVYGIRFNEQEINMLFTEISKKHESKKEIDKSKLHPLTRAFLNLEENMKEMENLGVSQ